MSKTIKIWVIALLFHIANSNKFADHFKLDWNKAQTYLMNNPEAGGGENFVFYKNCINSPALNLQS